jgi:Polyketide cyclase / dehydrase and lipid transport
VSRTDSHAIVGEATTTVTASADKVIDFVLDLEQYKRADHKIGRVGRVEHRGDTGTVEFSGRILGLPGRRGVYPYRRDSRTLEFSSPVAGPARRFMDFRGTFECRETADGTEVTHREIYEFKRPWRFLVGLLLRRWFERDTAKEMARFQEMLGKPERRLSVGE